jgi:formate hydrogenlyase subunit 6/NADH:ubiquinone oxidoreductase subunit I
MIDDTYNYQILFRHSLCVACGLCIEACPERCLSLERTIETEKLNSPATVLISDEIIRCVECDSPLGSRAMINSIKNKVTAAGGPVADFELCPDCKVKAQFLGVTGK